MDEGSHEFKCNAASGEFIHDAACNKYREIPVDASIFGQIQDHVSGIEDVKDIRKHIERPFNLLKHREGLEPVRGRSQHGLMAVARFSTMTSLLLEILATRKTERKENPQQKLKLAALYINLDLLIYLPLYLNKNIKCWNDKMEMYLQKRIS